MSRADERPRARAIALRYEEDEHAAPHLVAKGRGETAARILELARKHGIPVREDPDLLELLAACDVGEEIPTELYAAVAELLAYFYRLNEAARAEARPGAAGFGARTSDSGH